MMDQRSPVRALVFDLDGTLIDSLGEIATNCNLVLGRWGLPTHDIDAYRLFIGEGIRTAVQRIAPMLNAADQERFLADLHLQYSQQPGSLTRVFDDVPQVLAALAARRFAMAVLSNKPQILCDEAVGRFFADTPFVAVVGQVDSRPAKPDPAGLLDICQRLSLAPAEVAMVGDSNIDVFTAHRAGCQSIGVTWGFRTRQELTEAGAQQIIDSPLELLRCIGAVVPLG